eukprot:scaffold94456_cov21-Tisochrysis_lutea.AAC.2
MMYKHGSLLAATCTPCRQCKKYELQAWQPVASLNQSACHKPQPAQPISLPQASTCLLQASTNQPVASLNLCIQSACRKPQPISRVLILTVPALASTLLFAMCVIQQDVTGGQLQSWPSFTTAEFGGSIANSQLSSLASSPNTSPPRSPPLRANRHKQVRKRTQHTPNCPWPAVP